MTKERKRSLWNEKNMLLTGAEIIAEVLIEQVNREPPPSSGILGVRFSTSTMLSMNTVTKSVTS